MKRLIALLMGLAMVVAACGDGDGDTAADTAADATTAATDQVDTVQSSGLTFHMVTHSDDGVFWSVVKKGAEDAAAAVGAEMVWSPSSNDPEKQVQDLEAAVAAGSDGIGVSLANPEALVPAATAAVAGGIPVVTLNSGVGQYGEIGAITHVGQTEIDAGRGAGNFFNDLGATKILCGQQEQGNVGLEERCQGAGETFNGEVVTQFVGLDANPEEQINNIAAALQADADINAVFGVGPNVVVRAIEACTQAGRDCFLGGVDISEDVIAGIEAGDINFTIDQQQYLQGYLTIVILYLNATNLNTVGGGQPVFTGPGFVTTDNVGEVKALVAAGTR
ncbi:MAG: substrate-binding domain-containing protein [Acidimicrobiia bacterium]|nr:substrate-binding domain-containing protein [Acidimicrobiia bacterium]